MDQKVRLLFSYAHPDDETFGSGGTIARYADQGAEVFLICATGGELGTVAPELMEGYSSVADLRAEELACAAEMLGLSEVIMLGYRDSGMAGSAENNHLDSLWAAKLEVVSRRVYDEIQRLQPQVVVTFDSFGGYGHPDHIKIHQATTHAFENAVHEGPFRPQALYYSTFNRRPLRLATRLMRLFGFDPAHMGRNNDLNLDDIATVESTVHLRIHAGKYRQVAWHAAQCHESQLGGGNSFIVRLVSRLLFGSRESFEQAYPPQFHRQKSSQDLLSNVQRS